MLDPAPLVTPPFSLQAVDGVSAGAIDRLDYVDASPGLVPHPRPERVPLGAPVIAHGFAFDRMTGRAPLAVCVVVDGVRVVMATSGISRADIRATTGPNVDERIGYRVVVPTDGLPAGHHQLRAYAQLRDGRWYDAGGRGFRLYSTVQPELPEHQGTVMVVTERAADLSPNGSISFDAPIALGHAAIVPGWAFDTIRRDGVAGAVATAGSDRWTAPCDVARPDVSAAFGAAAESLGFELLVPTAALGRGRHTLRVRAYDRAHRTYPGFTEATLDVAGPMCRFPAFARLVRAAPRCAVRLRVADRSFVADGDRRTEVHARRGESLRAEGWAVTPEGAAAAEVFIELSVEGITVPPNRVTALAGYRRDVPPARLALPPVEDAWFDATVDSGDLHAGTYQLSLVTIAADRCSYARTGLGTLRLSGCVQPDSSGRTSPPPGVFASRTDRR